MQAGQDVAGVLRVVAERAKSMPVFGSITVGPDRVECEATGAAQPAAYRVEFISGSLYVSLVMADRWQSHSIEADLLNTGDKVEELVSDELVELGYQERTPGDSQAACEHFRSPEKLFTFRSKVPCDVTKLEAGATAAVWLAAYEAAFRRLGDMDAGGDEE